MQNSNAENNKRIAKNTLFLYFRSILTLGVGLYTSREILAQLGIGDFGIYNVVGGVIVLFSFIQGAMNSATSRFFTFDLGKGDFEQLKKTFSLSVVIHIFTALLILILGETLGLWFLNTQLVIPEERMGAANFIYQFSIFTACVGILQVPYMVAITAHERMKVFAYAGIADAVFKLAVVLALGFAPFDKLEFYSVLLFGVFVIMNGFYYVYCRRNFKETRFGWFWDKKMFLERMGFSGWTTLGGISAIAALQGVNMLLNVFHGVVANAAYGIMSQVNNAVTQFFSNFMAAVNPQIIKSYAKDDIEYLHNLIFRSIRLSFLLLSLFIIPIVLNMDFVLNLWLKQVPDFAVVFCQIRLLDHLFSYPLWCIFSIAIYATGKIKYFTIIDSILVVMNFVLCYVFFKLGFSPVTVPIVYMSMNLVRIIVINLFARKLIYISTKNFCKKVLIRIFAIFSISFPLPIWLYFNVNNSITLFFSTTFAFLFLFLSSSYLLGLESSEKLLLKNKISKLYAR